MQVGPCTFALPHVLMCLWLVGAELVSVVWLSQLCLGLLVEYRNPWSCGSSSLPRYLRNGAVEDHHRVSPKAQRTYLKHGGLVKSVQRAPKPDRQQLHPVTLDEGLTDCLSLFRRADLDPILAK